MGECKVENVKCKVAGGSRLSRSMRDSGIPWLGDVPEGWEIGCLSKKASLVKNRNEGLQEKNLLSLSYGKIKRKSIDTIGGLLPATFDWYNIIEANDIVLRLTDLQNDQHSLRVGLALERGIITSAYTTLRPDSGTDARCLFYLLYAFDIRKGFYGMGSGVRQGLNYGEVKRMVIPVPPLPEQRAIADYLDEKCGAIDAAVAEAKKGIEEYKAWKKSLIFEAVTGKRRVGIFNAEKQRSEEAEKMKPSGIPWIGAIPEGWRVVKASRLIASTQNGLTRRNLSESKGDIVLRLKNISPDGYIDYSDVVRIELSEKEKDTYCLTEGDLLFARVNGSRGLVGKCAVFVDNEECVAYNDHLIRVRVNGIVVRSFITYYLSSQSGRTEIELHTSTSAGQFTISGEGLRDIAVVLPPLPEQQAIADYLDETCAAIDALVTEKEALIADLEAYKKSLIYETVTGKREVA